MDRSRRFGLLAALLAALQILLLAACGGGGSTGGPTPPPAAQQMVGEIFAGPAQLATAQLKTGFGYSGNLLTSQALVASGRQNLLDLLFVIHGSSDGDKLAGRLAPDLEQRLQRYATDNQALLVPGVRVLIADEIFWNPPDNSDDPVVLQRQLDALASAVALTRKHMPQVSIGITVTPYATFTRANSLAFVRRALAIPGLGWVGTDPYWFGDPATLEPLQSWTRDFPTLARQANPTLETWLIAQAFRLPPWDLGLFRSFVAGQLGLADRYQGLIFFGWQFASELDGAIVGAAFDAETRALYGSYLP